MTLVCRKRSTIRGAIVEAYLDMLEEMPYSRIQVKDLVARADVARSTFYYNFDGSLEVLEGIEQMLLELLSLYPDKVGEVDAPPSPFDCMKSWFETCIEHHRALQAVTGEHGDPYFARRLATRLRREIDCMMDDDRLPAGTVRDYVSEAMASMCIGLMIRCVRNADDACEPDAEVLAAMVNLMRVAYHNDVADAPTITGERLYGESAGHPAWRS